MCVGEFLIGDLLIGFVKALPIFVELLASLPLFVFVGLSAGVTFVAYIGRNAAKSMRDGGGN